MELLFLGIPALLFIARKSTHILAATAAYLAVIGLAIILNLVFPERWGSVGLYSLDIVLLYSFPPLWSLPLAGVGTFVLAATEGMLPITPPVDPGTLAFNLILAGLLCWFGWILRTQYLLVVKLHEMQEQLQRQMVYSEELATERERTRIARDIHDVLSHSLAVLSIQVQAARHLVTRDPERLATKLDDMALLIRESITESRHVVGLLREKPPAPSSQDDLGSGLHAIARTFSERTGINCRFEESGTHHQVSPQHRETLYLALREMLTNAHRHGASSIAEITLRWREASIILTVYDNGMGANAVPVHPSGAEISQGIEGHHGHGLQGMRERAAALGGEAEAGPMETGGFTVTLRLPFESSGERSAGKGYQLG